MPQGSPARALRPPPPPHTPTMNHSYSMHSWIIRLYNIGIKYVQGYKVYFSQAQSLKKTISKLHNFKIFKVSKSQSFQISKFQNSVPHFQNVWDAHFHFQMPKSSNLLENIFVKLIWIVPWIIWSVLVSPKMNDIGLGVMDTPRNPEIVEMRGLRVLPWPNRKVTSSNWSRMILRSF